MIGCILCANSQARNIILVGNEWDKSDLHYTSSSEILNSILISSSEIRIKAIFCCQWSSTKQSQWELRPSRRTLLIKIATIKIFTVPNNHHYVICTRVNKSCFRSSQLAITAQPVSCHLVTKPIFHVVYLHKQQFFSKSFTEKEIALNKIKIRLK